MINIRQKGANGEREVYKVLNGIIQRVMLELNFDPADVVAAETYVQRNQNQSAVGGCDLVGTFGLAIEVKRQEQLSINTWWEQTLKSAQALDEQPVLVYRQNGKKWKAVTEVWLAIPKATGFTKVRAEMSWEAFQDWFYLIVKDHLSAESPTT